jgi:hypothetical protein
MWGTFVVVKRHKRLWIVRLEDDLPVYTPPDFVKLKSRVPLQQLARRFTEMQARDIGAITEFETSHH